MRPERGLSRILHCPQWYKLVLRTRSSTKAVQYPMHTESDRKLSAIQSDSPTCFADVHIFNVHISQCTDGLGSYSPNDRLNVQEAEFGRKRGAGMQFGQRLGVLDSVVAAVSLPHQKIDNINLKDN